MSPAIIQAALTGLLTIAGVVGAAWWTGRWSYHAKRLPPYEALSARVAVLESQVGQLRSRTEHLEDETSIWSDAWTDLETNWRTHRVSRTPPPRPIEIERNPKK